MKSSSITVKIWLGILTILAGYVISVVTFHHSSAMIVAKMKIASESKFPAAKISQRVLNGFVNHVKLFNDSVLLGDTGKIKEAIELGSKCVENLEQLLDIIDKDYAGYDIISALPSLLSDYTAKAAQTYLPLAEGESSEELIAAAGALATRKSEIQEKLEWLEKLTSDSVLTHLNNVRNYLEDKTRLNRMLFLVLFFSCIILVRFIINKYVVRPLSQITRSAQEMEKGNFAANLTYESNDEMGTLADAFRAMADSQLKKAELSEFIAGGDLTQEVVLASENDKLGRALADMVCSLNQIIHQINETSEQVVLKADQMATSSNHLSEGAIRTAASLEEISGSIVEIDSQTKANVENANAANQLALETKIAAEAGNGHMAELVVSISDIKNSSGQVGRIIKVIDDIAFQTNLLALNAAVEAARAGRHGKGFAVVADEVRNLAGRSAKAARETSELISSSVQKVEIGSQIASRTEASLKGIVAAAVKMASLVSEINMASKEQANSIAQISQGLGQIDAITQQNASNAEETAAASEELSSQACNLKEQLGRFILKGS